MGSTGQRQKDDMVLLAHVRSQFVVSNGTYGYARGNALTERKVMAQWWADYLDKLRAEA